MTKKHSIIVLTFSLLVSLAFLYAAFIGRKSKPSAHYTVKVFEGAKGWGYDIFANDSLLIHQESIPVLAEDRGFSKRSEANTAAMLVVDKLVKRKNPAFNKQELEHILLLKR